MSQYSEEYGSLVVDFYEIQYWIENEDNKILFCRWHNVEIIEYEESIRKRSGLSAVQYAEYLKKKEARKRIKKKAITKRRNEFAKNRALLILKMLESGIEYICAHQNCNEYENLTVDHIKALSRGGTDDIENLQFMCGSHNSSKGDK